MNRDTSNSIRDEMVREVFFWVASALSRTALESKVTESLSWAAPCVQGEHEHAGSPGEGCSRSHAAHQVRFCRDRVFPTGDLGCRGARRVRIQLHCISGPLLLILRVC